MSYEIIQGDCLEVMRGMADSSVDAIITDLPYGTTAIEWDSVIPFGPMWEGVKRILKPNGVFVTTASQPFTTELIASNLKMFKHSWVWNKKRPANVFLAKTQPMKIHEDVLVFSKNTPIYNPIMIPRDKVKLSKHYGPWRITGGNEKPENEMREYTHKYPKSIIDISNASQKSRVHPTQKPVDLYEYLIRTYTNAGETVLDICMGSGTTGVAAMNTGRRFIGIERESEYVDLAQRRIEAATAQLKMEVMNEQ